MLKWLLIGPGDIATRRVLPAILAEPRSALVGIVTRNAAHAAPYSVPAFTDLSEALRQSDAHAVYVATPVFLHAAQSVACLHAGRHVLCEKPMAMNPGEAHSMNIAAREANRILGVAYYRRWYPKVNRAKVLLEAGVIGRPVLAEATCHAWFYPGDGPRAWLTDAKASGGGPLYDIACHRIDLMNYLFGAPARVSAHRSTLVHPIDVEDNATVMIDYQHGTRAVVDVRWHSRIARDEFRIRGTEGEMDLTPLNSPVLTYAGVIENLSSHENLHYPLIHDFVEAVLDGADFKSSGDSAAVTDWITGEAMSR